MISFIAKLFVALNSNSRPGEIASGLAFGFWLALLPGGNLLWILLFAAAFFLKHNLAALLLGLAVFRSFLFLADPLLDLAGGWILQAPFLRDVFLRLAELPLVSYTRFNNTLVMGALVIGLLAWVPLYLLFLQLVRLYRKKAAPALASSRLVKTLKGVPLISKLASAAGKIGYLG